MALITLLLVIVLIGLVVWLINTFTPIAPQFKTLVLVVGMLVAVLYVLSAFGILGHMGSVRVPTVR